MSNNKIHCGVCGKSINLKKIDTYKITKGVEHCKTCIVVDVYDKYE